MSTGPSFNETEPNIGNEEVRSFLGARLDAFQAADKEAKQKQEQRYAELAKLIDTVIAHAGESVFIQSGRSLHSRTATEGGSDHKWSTLDSKGQPQHLNPDMYRLSDEPVKQSDETIWISARDGVDYEVILDSLALVVSERSQSPTVLPDLPPDIAS